jgi:ABC-type transport system involved in cytochrome bd biosynthesis fused ATPase/permease subunit
MIEVLTALKVAWLVSWATGGTIALIDSAWAIPLNTFLLLLTLVAGAFLNRKVDKTNDRLQENTEITANAAEASASAAEASAHAAVQANQAARIAKELGGRVRHVDVPTVPTDPTGAVGGGT